MKNASASSRVNGVGAGTGKTGLQAGRSAGTLAGGAAAPGGASGKAAALAGSAAAKGTAKTGFWLVVLGAALWGVDPLFRVILLKSLTSAQIVLIEHIIIALVAVPVLWKNRSELKGLGWRHAGALLFISWGGSAIATILFTMALSSGDLNAVLLLQKCSRCSPSCSPACY